jgi:hypothetical protein
MKYEKINQLSPAEIETAISRNNSDDIVYAVLSAALHSEDAAWAEDVCVRLAAHENENVRGNAILGLGHIARIHGQLTEARVRPLIESAFEDASAFVRDHAESAEDDVKLFLGWRLKREKKPRG